MFLKRLRQCFFLMDIYVCVCVFFLIRWAAIASELPGRTDNDVKNFWNSHLRKRLSTFKSVDPRLNTPSDEGDYFLRLWNSQVGHSFRTMKDQMSSSLKVENVAAAYEMDDSSDAMLKLLLDFPVGDDNMGFLESPHHHVSTD